MNKLILIIATFFVTYIHAQEYSNDNNIYNKDIKSLQTLVNGRITSIPILSLGSSDLLTIQFDDISDEEDNEFYYRVQFCDKDWNVTNLDPLEYVDGFHEERLRDWQLSIVTKTLFAHYWVSFPNRDTRFKISGNYLIHVYNKYDEEVPLFTRRIIVAEGRTAIGAKWVRPSNTDDIRFKQQLNLTVLLKDLRVQNAMRDIDVTIVQNGDWSSSMKNIKARNFKDNLFTFDNFGQLTFNGVNEYRSFDTRSLRGRGWGVKSIDRSQGVLEITLNPGLRRDQNVYTFNFDFNGNYFVDNRDDFDRLIFEEAGSISEKNKLLDFRNNFAFFDNRSDVWQLRDKDTRADYANIIFSLKSDKLDDDVYVVSSFTDFKCKPEYKMKYSGDGTYTCETLLKQGFYDYRFATSSNGITPNYTYTEGSWQDAENEYQIIVYLKEYGARYDRVIGVFESNSTQF